MLPGPIPSSKSPSSPAPQDPFPSHATPSTLAHLLPRVGTHCIWICVRFWQYQNISSALWEQQRKGPAPRAPRRHLPTLSWSLLQGAQAAQANATSTETAAAMYKKPEKRWERRGGGKEEVFFYFFFSSCETTDQYADQPLAICCRQARDCLPGLPASAHCSAARNKTKCRQRSLAAGQDEQGSNGRRKTAEEGPEKGQVLQNQPFSANSY